MFPDRGYGKEFIVGLQGMILIGRIHVAWQYLVLNSSNEIEHQKLDSMSNRCSTDVSTGEDLLFSPSLTDLVISNL